MAAQTAYVTVLHVGQYQDDVLWSINLDLEMRHEVQRSESMSANCPSIVISTLLSCRRVHVANTIKLIIAINKLYL